MINFNVENLFLASHKDEFEAEWQLLISKLSGKFKKTPDLDALLFLIGVQELGQGPQLFSKEDKQNLMHIGVCKVLSLSGYYTLEGLDKDGWPHWKAAKKAPFLTLEEQEKFLKFHVVRYFKEEAGLV